MRVRSPEYLAKQRETKAQIALRRRAFAISYLGGKCSKCESRERLEIDHINKSEKSFPISRPPNENAFREELTKCQLLCYDCHRLKSSQEEQGEKNPSAKLTKEDVQEIRVRLVAGESGVSLAKEFDVCAMQISRIKNNKRWKHAID